MQPNFTDQELAEIRGGLREDAQQNGTFKAFEAGGGFAPFEPFEPPNTSRLPPFPIESLPPPLRSMTKAAAENLQVAVDMTAVVGLAVISLCVQRIFIIKPKPGWIEQLNLYAAVGARPSERKTPVLSVMTYPLHAYEKAENERRAPLVEQYRTKKTILEKKIATLKELAGKPTKKGEAVDLDDIVELQYQLADLEREAVKPLRLLADDITAEALISLMATNDGRMGIFSDEGGLFDVLAGRYNGGKVNMDVFLKSYSGGYLRIDRMGRPPEDIENPSLTMLLMIQPVVLEAIMGNQDFAGRGFLARLLYSLPASTIGRRAYDTPPIPKNIEENYAYLIEALLSIPDLGEPRVIQLSPEAHQEAKRFAEELEPRLMDDLGGMDDLEGWAGKYHGKIMRIAGIIHCCLHTETAAEKPLSLNTMKHAEIIGGYFLEHAKAAFQIMGMMDGKEVKDAKYILRRLKEDGRTEINKRDLNRLCQKFRSAEDMEPGLNELILRGYIRVETIKTGKRGNPAQIVYLSPEAV